MLQTLQTTVTEILGYLLDACVLIRIPYPWYGQGGEGPRYYSGVQSCQAKGRASTEVCRTKCVPDLRTSSEETRGYNTYITDVY